MRIVKENGEDNDFLVETQFYSIKTQLPKEGQVALVRLAGTGDLWVGRFGKEKLKTPKGNEEEVSGWYLFDGYSPSDGIVRDTFRVTHWARFTAK